MVCFYFIVISILINLIIDISERKIQSIDYKIYKNIEYINSKSRKRMTINYIRDISRQKAKTCRQKTKTC